MTRYEAIKAMSLDEMAECLCDLMECDGCPFGRICEATHSNAFKGYLEGEWDDGYTHGMNTDPCEYFEEMDNDVTDFFDECDRVLAATKRYLESGESQLHRKSISEK